MRRTEHADSYRASDPDRRFIQSREWRERIRPRQLDRQPLCEHCRELGLIVAASQVDHIIRPKGNRALQRAFSNFQSLCAEHHARKSRWERGTSKRPLRIGVDAKTGWPIELLDGHVPKAGGADEHFTIA